MSPLVRLCCALAVLVLGAALYTNVASSASGRAHGPDDGGNAAAARAFRAAAVASPSPPTALVVVDSLSDVAANDGHCTLREAITSANTSTASGAASGECPAGSANTNISISVAGTITLTSALPAITSTVNINGSSSGLNDQIISGNNANRVFNVASGTTVTISYLTISGGRADFGGGVYNAGTLTINNCAVTGNGVTNNGGGVINVNSGTLNVNNSTIASNSTDPSGGGGGLYNSGNAVLTNTTVSANGAGDGGGLQNVGTLTLTNVTVYGNTAANTGGGVYNPGVGLLNLSNTIVAGNSAGSSGPDCNGANVISQDYNLVGNTAGCSIGGTTTHNVTGVDAKLGPLQSNGGPTRTHALLPGSPAIDAGNGTPGADQRGFPRPVNFVTVTDAAGGNGSDIGAFEAGPTELLVVNSLLDTDDNSCDSQDCTLREAIGAANSNTDQSAIYFSVTGTINLTGALPGLGNPFTPTPLTINGPGSGLLTVRRDTGGVYRIFITAGGTKATISGLTIANGKTDDGAPGTSFGNQGGNGGGVYNAGTLNLKDCVITGNSTGNGGVGSGGTSDGFGGSGGEGGGVYNAGTLTMTDCTVSSNHTGNGAGGGYAGGHGGLGGGISSYHGALTLTNCVVSNNSTGTGGVGTNAGASGGGGGDGGGVYTDAGTLNITNTVVSNNVTGNGAGESGGGGIGGGILSGGATSLQTTSTLTNVTVRDNRTGDASAGFVGQGGFGGGIHNGGNMTVNGITVSGNVTGSSGPNGGGVGGGIANGGTLTISNGTISGNRAGVRASGGGIWNSRSLSLTNCTIADNSSAFGGSGIHSFSSLSVPMSVGNTIVAGNTLTGSTSATQVTGVYTSQGHNLIGAADGDSTGFTDGVNGDIVGTIAAPVNARLSALGNYGGTTQTHALLPGSPAINAGTGTGAPAADQRGVSRVGAVDIGAFESRGFGVTPAAGSTPQGTPIKTAFGTALSATVASAFGEPVSGGVLTFSAPASGASGTFASTATAGINAGGVATAPAFTANALAGGYNVTASTAGASSAAFALTNLKGTQTIVFGPLPDKTYGDAFQLSAEGGDSVSPVTFASQTADTCSVSGNTVTALRAGTCSVTASQKGDSNYNDAPDVTQSFSILKATTATAFSSSPNPSAPGQPFTFTAAVTSGAGTPTGFVQFKSGALLVGDPQPLNAAGVATLSGSWLGTGPHDVTAEYGGDSNFKPSAAALPGGQLVGSLVEFAQSAYAAAERDGGVIVNVTRTGDTSTAVDVDYATDDGSVPGVAMPCADATGLALDRCDFTKALGTLHFAAGETEKSFKVLISDDSYNEGAEALTLRLSNPSYGAALGARTAAPLNITDDSPESSGNTIDDDEAFVRQHYRDFLNREADADGLKFWTDGIRACGADAGCREVKRVDTSAAFFLSIEFQETGYLVYRTYRAAYGDAASPNVDGTVPVVRLGEFLTDTQRIGRGVVVNSNGWEQLLEANKQAYALEFVQRARFATAFPATLTADAFVNQLDQNAGGVLSADEKTQLAGSLGSTPGDPSKRAAVLRQVAENAALRQRETNRAFVLMEFFGYLRRDPDAAPDADFRGWKFWLDKLDSFGGDYRRAEMVKAFLSSIEYRQRFGH